MNPIELQAVQNYLEFAVQNKLWNLEYFKSTKWIVMSIDKSYDISYDGMIYNIKLNLETEINIDLHKTIWLEENVLEAFIRDVKLNSILNI